MAGTINLALTQQLDEFGAPLSGGQLYLIQAGTVSTPQNGFQDTGLSIALPNPITLDAAGRIPQFFLADGQIKVRLQDKNGIVKFVQDNLLVIGPSAAGGGGGAVDPTTVMATGDLKVRYDTAIISGFVRANGKTIGNSSSGATELADTTQAQALYLHLWNKDPNLVVLGGRGASAAADFIAPKQLTLPDWRGRAIAALDDMGNTAAGRLTATYLGTGATTLGAAGGAQSVTLVTGNLPAHQHSAFVKINDPTHFHLFPQTFGGTGTGTTPAAAAFSGNTPTAPASTGITANVGSAGGLADNQTAATGSGTAFSQVQPTMLATVYLKL
jgi:microcystin-dependent protein